MYKVFVDGSAGTTGLQILQRLEKRNDIELIVLPDELRKDERAKKEAINKSDVTILCLPDEAAKASVALCENENTIIIDASTAHRTNESFAYGFAELSPEFRNKIKTSKRIANPGCHASGFCAAVYPLTASGIMGKDYPVTASSITGYSGGGKSMIADYNENGQKESMCSPRFYSLNLTHKHLPEMSKVCSLENAPVFTPIVSKIYNGMLVSIPIVNRLLNKKMTAEEIHGFYKEYYKNEYFVRVMPFGGKEALENGFLPATECNGTNFLDIFVFGNESQTLVVSRLDNLGKGASGAAVQNMNIALGLDEKISL
ncbi:MAG: N-acetyl-gamma-glutamyl-phosphate reductase [Ruminococcaceae bacterium]|nr:N-acetyl-gamma-glutamyl-phosphate reductase [Oscillospiraceae bacterium]